MYDKRGRTQHEHQGLFTCAHYIIRQLTVPSQTKHGDFSRFYLGNWAYPIMYLYVWLCVCVSVLYVCLSLCVSECERVYLCVSLCESVYDCGCLLESMCLWVWVTSYLMFLFVGPYECVGVGRRNGCVSQVWVCVILCFSECIYGWLCGCECTL